MIMICKVHYSRHQTRKLPGSSSTCRRLRFSNGPVGLQSYATLVCVLESALAESSVGVLDD